MKKFIDLTCRCGTVFSLDCCDYRKRIKKSYSGEVFCSKTCSTARKKKKMTYSNCVFCNGKAFGGNKYCTPTCQQKSFHEERVKNWHKGDWSGRGVSFFKRAVRERDGLRCSVCSISTWNGSPLTLELEHKNGNSSDNSSSNLCLLCPNCHSQTPTFRAKNRVNGRRVYRADYYKKNFAASPSADTIDFGINAEKVY